MVDAVADVSVTRKKPAARILLVDDDEFVRRVYGRVLIKNGYDTRTVSNAAAALTIAVEWRPDVILLDIAMPFITGFEAAPILKIHPATRSAALVAFSLYIEDSDAAAMQHYDFDAVLPKPHDRRTRRSCEVDRSDAAAHARGELMKAAPAVFPE